MITIFFAILTTLTLIVSLVFLYLALLGKDGLGIVWAYYGSLTLLLTIFFLVLTNISLLIGYCFQ